MERFNAANLCPHCEGVAASYKLHTGRCPELGAEGRHMHRQCPSCGYQWAEAPRMPPVRSGKVVDLRRREQDAASRAATG